MKIIIDGAGEVGSHLAKMLCEEGNSVTVIDSDDSRLMSLNSSADVLTICGDPSSLKVLHEAGADKADLMIAVNPDVAQEMNITVATLAKQMGTAKVAARIKNEEFQSPEGLKYLQNIGIDLAFYPEKIAADEILSLLKHNASTEMTELGGGQLSLAVFKLDEDSPMLDLKLLESVNSIDEELRSQFRIIAIARDRNTIIPRPDTKFRFGDTVYVVAHKNVVNDVCQSFGHMEIEAKNIMIIGGGSMGSLVAREMSNQDVKVTLIEKDRERCLHLTEILPNDVEIIHADGSNTDSLFDEGIAGNDSFLALTGSDEVNILACVAAKKFGVPRTIAEVENIEYMHLAEELGVDIIINKKLMSASRIFRFTLSTKARFLKSMTGINADILEYTVHHGSKLIGKSIKDIKFPEDTIMSGISRGKESIIPVGDTVLAEDDRVVVFVMPDALKDVEKMFK